MSNEFSIKDTIVPKSDQLNSEEIVNRPLVITITNTRKVGGDQPIIINYSGDNGKPYKPCKIMRKLISTLWGDDIRAYTNKSMQIYNDPDVHFGKHKNIGGIRISHMTDLPNNAAEANVPITVSQGVKKTFNIKRLDVVDTTTEHRTRLESSITGGTESFKAAWTATPAAIQKQLGAAYKDDLKLKAEKAVAPVVDTNQESFE